MRTLPNFKFREVNRTFSLLLGFLFISIFCDGQSNNSAQIIRYGGIGNDMVNQMVLSKQNLYFVGSFSDTISFDTTRLGSNGFFDAFLAKTDSLGHIIWAKQIGGKLNDNITSVVVDKQGNVYVVGYFQKKAKSGSVNLESTYYYSNFLAKFNPSGNQLWIQKFSKHNQLSDCRLTIDTAGMVYLTGEYSDTLYLNHSAFPSKGLTDIFIAKYANDGTTQWIRTIGGPKSEYVNSIFIDANQSILLGGSFEDSISADNVKLKSKGGKDALLVRLDHSGNIVSMYRYGGNKDDEIISIVSDSLHNIYAAGNFCDSATFGNLHIKSNGNQDGFIARFSPNGNVRWINPIGGYGDDGSNSIYLTKSNEVLICGYFRQLCYFHCGASISNNDSLVSGSPFNNILIGKYDSLGILRDKYQVDSPSEVLGRDIAMKRGVLYLAGNFRQNIFLSVHNQEYSSHAIGNKDLFLLRIANTCENYHVKISVDTIYQNESKSYVLDAGSGYSSYLWNDTIIGNHNYFVQEGGKYKVEVTNTYGCKAQDSVFINNKHLKMLSDSVKIDKSNSESRLLVYPNPVKSKITILLKGQNDNIQTVEVVDLCGKLEKSVRNVNTNTIILDFSDKPSSIYYLKIATTNCSKVIKVVKN